MWRFFQEPYVVLAAVVAIGGGMIVALTWRDSRRLLREFFSPLKLHRPRFRLIHLFVITAIVSLLVKIATIWPWAEFYWLDNLSVMATISLGVSLAAAVVYLFVTDNFQRRRKPLNHKIVPPAADKMTIDDAKSEPAKIRFPTTKRPTSRFKW